MVYIPLSCVSAVVLRSVLSSNNKVDDDDDPEKCHDTKCHMEKCHPEKLPRGKCGILSDGISF